MSDEAPEAEMAEVMAVPFKTGIDILEACRRDCAEPTRFGPCVRVKGHPGVCLSRVALILGDVDDVVG